MSLLLVALSLVLLPGCLSDLATTTVFTHGERADCVCIRGPQLVLAGSTLVAFADCVPAAGDNCQPLRPHKPPPGAVRRQIYKRSTDGGSTFGSLTNAPALGVSPVALQDGTLLLIEKTSNKVWRSADGAATWKVTERTNNSTANSGGLIQLSAGHKTHPGRLLGVHKVGSGVGQIMAQSCWSDDSGESWQESSMKQAHMDESEVVELADGAIALLSRNWLNCSAIPLDAPCREHQDGPCMCTAVATSSDGGETWDGPSVPVPSLAGANCHSAAVSINGSTYFSAPIYTGPARLPNPPHKPCGYDPVSKRTGHCYTDRAPNRINGTVPTPGNLSMFKSPSLCPCRFVWVHL